MMYSERNQEAKRVSRINEVIRIMKSPLEQPRYRDLSIFLREEIDRGRFGVGDKIPTEPELCNLRGVSRTTVRLAVQELVDEGILDRRQGKGTFVAALPNSMNDRGLFQTDPPQDHQFRFVASGWSPASFGLAAAFGLPADGELFFLTRLRLEGGYPVAVKRYFAPATLLRDAPPTTEELETRVFDRILMERGIRLTSMNVSAEPTYLEEADAALLGAEPGGLTLFTQRVGFNETNRAVRLSQTVLRSDKARLFWSVRRSLNPKHGEEPSFSVWTTSALD
jgi:GntR family transcriptional regulator